MTERKPPGVSSETWVDRQIRDAQEQGDFESLPGFGKPLPNLDQPYDEYWWVKQKLEREGVSFLPPTLVLRKEAEDALVAAAGAPSEADVRRIVSDINDRIRESLRQPPDGPPLNLTPYDLEDILEEWRRGSDRPAERAGRDDTTEERAIPPGGAKRRFRWRWPGGADPVR